MTPEVGRRTAGRRLAAVKLVEGGMSQAEVARAFGVSREAVRKWAARYAAGGESGLLDTGQRRGPKRRISEEQARALMARAREAGAKTLAEIHALAPRVLRIALSRSALRRGLMAAGLWPT